MKEAGVAAEVIVVSADRARKTNLRPAPATTHPDCIAEISRLGPADRATARKQPLHLQELTFLASSRTTEFDRKRTSADDVLHQCWAAGSRVEGDRCHFRPASHLSMRSSAPGQ